VIAAPRHFTALAGRLRWDPDAIDLDADRRAWPELPVARRERLGALLCGFLVAEASVAAELAPFPAAAGDADTAAALRAQGADEERHARLFDRIAAVVLALPGDGPEQRRAAAREAVPAALRELFEKRLHRTARALAAGQVGLDAAVGLYHLLIEGLVLSAGQRALLDDLGDGALPGVRAGVERVERDERWHVGFGLRCLHDLRPEPGALAALADAGDGAAATWGDLVPAAVRARVAAMHRRRLASIAPGHAAAGSLA
jgi:ribonucleoside-diphosphate reductase beta chain